MGERGERVKEKSKINLERCERCVFIGGNEGKNSETRTTGEVKNRIFERRRAGLQAVAIGALNRQPLGMTAKEWERAKALYVSGRGWKAIGEQLKLNVDTLKSKASREGVTKLRKETEAIISSEISVRTEKSLEALSALVRGKLAEDASSTLERVNGYCLDGIKDEATREQILGSVAKRSALVFGWSEGNEATSVSINLLGSMPDRFAEVVVSNPV
jgi:hypothetical protein